MTTSTTVNDNNTSATENATITTANATANLNNSSGTDTVTTDGTGTTTVNANNSTGTDDVYIANASSATVNLNNSTGNDDVDISGAIVNATVNDNNSGVAGVSGNDCIDITGATVTAAVNLNNSVGNDDVTIAGTTSVNATVNDNNSGVVGGTDIIDITGAAIIATVNLNNSVGNDDVIIGGAGTTSVKATVNLNNSGGTDVVNVTGASATVTVNLTNSAGGDLVDLVGAGTGTINATNSLGNNTLVGDNTTDTITGGTGNDIVDLMGAGTIDAGKGNDLGIYDLLDHYGKGGGADYYYGQGGTDTLEIVWNASLYNPAVNTAIQTQINGYYTFLAGHPDVNQTYTFNFGGNTAPLTVAGWRTLKISGLMPVIAVPGAQNLTPGQTTLITGVSLSETGNVAGETFTVTLSDTSGDLSANKSAPGGGGTITGSGTTGLTITGTLAQVNADLTTLKDTVATPDTIRLSATDSYGNSAIEQAIAVGSCGDITATGKNVSATEGISTGTVTVATFTDANPLATTADFTATITWGDGTTSSGTVSESSGVFTVGGSHTYAEDGSYAPTVTINDDGGSTATDGGTTTVADAALTAGAATVSGGVEGVTAATLSATFTDANTGAPASDFSGTIDWGDGTAAQSFTSSAVSGSGGSYTVGGSHTYAEEGSYTPTVTINDDGGSTATDSGTTTVADAALTAGAATVSGGVEGVTAATLSATFTDANTGAPASDFSGTIDWGDGTAAQSFTSSAVSGGGGSYTVGGSHTYAEDGSYTPTVTINDDGGSTATDSGTTTVADAALTAGAATVSGGVEGVTAATLSATFTDANTGAPASDFSGTIDWGDGTAAQSFTSSAVSGGGGSYTVGGSHTYAEDGSYTPTVTINDDGGSTATDSGTTTVADAALTAGAATVSGGVEGVTAATLSATFTDANTGAPASDFSGTIDWGDGTAAQSFTSSAVSGSGGSYTVGGSHTYAEDGSYTPTVTINDDGGSTATDGGTTTVADAALTAGAATVSGGVEGVTAATLSATFTDANTGAPASDFSGTIDWGDGTAAQSFTSSAVSGSGGSYTVGGSHTYAEDGSYTPTVTINDDGGSTATDGGTTTVADAALTAGAATVSGGVEGVTAATLSATFTDANTGAPASDFSGTIDWGDGTAAQSFTSSAVSGSGGSYTVGGSHTYAEDGSYTPTVTINDDGGSTATDSGTTTVADAALTAGAATVSGGVEGVTAATLSATFTDANTGAPASDFSGTIDWGDGTATQSFASSAVSGGGGSYTVGGSHTYAEDGSYTPTVTINDDGGSTATDGGTTTVADAALTATGKNVSATEGSSTGTVTVATFTDANPNAPTTDFTATINWGDGGATSTGTVTESSGVFSVSGSHTYAAQGTDTISVSISDDGGSMASPSSTATVAEVLDASNTVPGAQSATEGVNKAITGISISDLDATGNVTTTLSVLHGTLTVLTNVTNGLTAGEVTNNGTGTVTLTGTVTQINTTLEATNGLVYLEQGDHTSDTLTVATQDQGTSPLLTATSNVTINVTEALDATNTVPGAQSATEGVNKAITGVSVSDADATGNVTTTLSVMHGTLTVLTNVSGGLTAIGVSGNGTGTVVLTGSVTQIDNTLAATNGLVYLTTGSQNDTLSVATQDQGTSPLLTATNTVAINVTASGPTVTSVSYTTSTGNTEIDHKDSATITLTFSEAVTVTGAPLLTLNVIEGGTPDTATFTSGSGTNKLVFTYTVPNSGAGDQTTALAITAINLKGGTIQDAAHINANTTGADVTLSPHLGVNEPAAPAGVAGDPINLALTDPSAGQAAGPITLMFTGVPSDWSLNQGTNLGNGSWTVQTSDPTALTVTTPASFAGAALLGVAASWTNADGGAGTASLQTNVEAYAPGSPIFAVSGDDTLTGGGGNDEFVFAQPIGNDTVYNFNVASDQIDLIGFNNFTTFVDIQANMADDANGNAVITAATGESVTIVGVDAALLTASDFVLNQEPLTNSAGTMTVGDAAMLPLGGTIDNTGTIALGSTGDETDLEILVKGATLQGGGQVTLSDNGQNVIFGGAADAVLTNVDNTISGAGRLGDGQMTLVNDGTIDATGTNALVLDTGTNIITNSGTLEATGTGGLIVNSAVDNSGSLSANGGNLTLNGAVTGNGTATISGAATLEFGAASAEATSFAAGATGTLKLDQSSGFTGVVSGFGAGDALDLADIAFGANTTIGYSVNADGAGGTLSVSDGTHSAGIALFGQYAASGFQVGSDNGTGAIVTYTPPTASLDAALITNPNQKT